MTWHKAANSTLLLAAMKKYAGYYKYFRAVLKITPFWLESRVLVKQPLPKALPNALLMVMCPKILKQKKYFRWIWLPLLRGPNTKGNLKKGLKQLLKKLLRRTM